MARAGRRPGSPHTAGVILGAARDLFAERGYQATSIRAVAERSGVNPALVHHYFGPKQQLFLAALQLPIDPAEVITTLLAAGPRDEFAERLVRFFVTAWRAPDTGRQLQAVLRSAVTTDNKAAMIRALADAQILDPLTIALDVPGVRVAAAISHLIGLVLAATILRIEPLASATDEELISLVVPAIEHYLTPGLPR